MLFRSYHLRDNHTPKTTRMNNYKLLNLIDDVLVRLHAVRPPLEHQHDGPVQWLYLAEPKISHEIELVQLTTVLSDPLFPPLEKPDRNGLYHYPDGTTSLVPPPPVTASGSPLPQPRGDQVSYSVDYRLVQAFNGLRAVLLVLIDSCGSCARDADFIGNQPYTDSTTVLKEMSRWSEDAFVPNAKFWKDWPLARFLRNPLPPVPSTWTRSPMSSLFSGETGRYFNRLATYPADRDDSFVYYRAVFGLAQSKRGFAQVPQKFVKKSMLKHAAQLSTPPTSDPDLEAARLFARSFFSGFRCPKIFRSLPSLEGSLKASVEMSRQHGGARAFIRMLTAEYRGYPYFSENFSFDDDPLVRMFNPDATQVIEERGLPPLSPEEWRFLAVEYTPAKSRSHLHPRAQDAIEKLAEHEPDALFLPVARVAEVLEPLKVRLITAMNAVRSHISRPLQRALWKWLRSSPVFQLIGEPISEDLIHDLVMRHLARGGREDPFVSGDYSAATDGLDIRLSKAILEVILECLDPEDIPFKDIIASILYEQVLIYPGWTKIAPVVQKNGQLMGSVLSFPILCLANLFAYIMSLPDHLEILKSRVRMDKLAVLINGDDILFRSSDSHYKEWLNQIQKVGFTQSVGKNFRHPRFLTVNSIPIEYRKAQSSYQFWKSVGSWADIEERVEIPDFDISQVPSISIKGFLNVGLLTGQAKLTGREFLGALPLSGWHAGAVLEALNPAQAHKWFLHYHRQSIQSQTRFGGATLNIFAHPLLGGLGFTVPQGVEPRFSPEQRRLARALFLSASYTYDGQEKSYALDSLLFLESDNAISATVLGRLNRRVNVELYPTGTPLPEGYTPFVDKTGIQPLAMVHAPPWTGEPPAGLKARCRLSSNRIRRLTHRFGNNLVDLHPLDKMTEFPFTPVRVTSSTFIKSEAPVPRGELPQERFYSRVYCQESPFQEISTPLQDEPVIIPPTVLEDWETADVTLRVIAEPIPAPPPASESLRAIHGRRQRVLDLERSALNRGMIRVRTALEQSYFD